jgi:hypothetical protein
MPEAFQYGWWKRMSKLFFPQLPSGAMAQFPFSKQRTLRNIQNALADGSILVSPDPNASRTTWILSLHELSAADLQAIESHFAVCLGPLRAFTFLDPSDNMLPFSSDLTNPAWNVAPNLLLSQRTADPFGGSTGFVVTNTGQTPQTIGQTLTVPSNYQYCFSIYVRSADGSKVTLNRRGGTDAASTSFPCGTSWSRIVSTGRLNDAGITLTVEVQLQPGQTVQLCGPQLEPQIEPSRYRPTTSRSGVYANAHWASNQLWISADAPNSFATSLAIECTV